MKGYRRIAAALLGTVLFVAGVLKLMDPVGTTLLVDGYLGFFRVPFLGFASGVLAVLIPLVEAVLGAALITGVWRKVSAVVSLVVLSCFTLVTLVLLVANPDMDCGCFGEAIPLSHTQSFVKNLILLAFWAIAFIPLRHLGEARRIKYVSFFIALASLCLFTLYSQLSIPMADFTPYRPGTELEGAADDDFNDITAHIYEKNGREGAFTTDCPPDSSWTYVREQTYDRSILSGNAVPSVLSFYDATGEYCDSLAVKGKVMVVSVYDPGTLAGSLSSRISDFVSRASSSGYTPLVLVASLPQDLEVSDPALAQYVYFADRRTLMTLNRSNGGATFVSDGQIVRKWSSNAYPSDKDLGKALRREPTEYMLSCKNKSRVTLQGFFLYVGAVMFLL